MKYILIATIMILCFASVGWGDSPPHDKIIYICGCGGDYEMLEGGMYRCTNRANHRKMIDKGVYSLLQKQLSDLQLELAELRFSIEALKDGFRSKHPLVKDSQSK